MISAQALKIKQNKDTFIILIRGHLIYLIKFLYFFLFYPFQRLGQKLWKKLKKNCFREFLAFRDMCNWQSTAFRCNKKKLSMVTFWWKRIFQFSFVTISFNHFVWYIFVSIFFGTFNPFCKTGNLKNREKENKIM